MSDDVIHFLWKNCLYHLPHKITHRFLYAKYHEGNRIDFDNVTLYDEKIHWLIAYYYDDRFGKYADKIAVRDYVADCGLKDILIPVAGKGVYKKPEDINLKELPDRFVLKTNNGSGSDCYYICKNKNDVNMQQLISKFNKALKINFGKNLCEYHYNSIVPKLICEQLLESGNEDRVTDYKVVCSYGKAYAILVCSGRDEGRDYFDLNWEYLPYVKEEYRYDGFIQKPRTLDRMIKSAEILSKPFPLARIDFYSIEDKLYFGEITLTPSSGNHKYLNELGQIKLGEAVRIKSIK